MYASLVFLSIESGDQGRHELRLAVFSGVDLFICLYNSSCILKFDCTSYGLTSGALWGVSI